MPLLLLDLQTTLMIGCATSMVIAVSFAIQWFVTNRHPGLPWICTGYVLGSVSAALVVGRLYNLFPASLASFFVVNVGQSLAALCWAVGVATIYGKRIGPLYTWGIVALHALLVAYSSTVDFGFQLRLALVSLVSCYFYLLIIGTAYAPLKAANSTVLMAGVLLPFAMQAFHHALRGGWLVLDLWHTGGQIHGTDIAGALGKSQDVSGALFNVISTFAMAFSIMMMVSDRMTQRLQDLASHDSLTGALNRRAFMEQLPRDRSRAHRKSTHLALLLIDVDHFKAINDTHGHLAGDAYLRALVLELRSVLRQEDLLCRYGGEEFCAAVVVDDRASALHMAERLRARIEALQLPFEGVTLAATISIGVALLDDENDAAVAVHSALQNADLAVYEAKHQGRNQVQFQAAQLTPSPA